MSKNLSVTSDPVLNSFEKASGPIDYSFTNDYMFRGAFLKLPVPPF